MQLRLYGLLDGQLGGSLINLTKFLYGLGSNTADYAEPITVGSLQTTKGPNRLRLFPKQTAMYVEDASFLKLRELTLSVEVPSTMVSRFGRGVRTAELSFSGRNLWTHTDYTGLDPEVSNFGNQPIGRNIDVAPFPPSPNCLLDRSMAAVLLSAEICPPLRTATFGTRIFSSEPSTKCWACRLPRSPRSRASPRPSRRSIT